jgi:glycosyltransferase involved in cell wall biosynthesis
MVKKICLTMIVLDEALIITRCLDSVVEYLDYWCICDTGSTDGTQQVIHEYFKQHNIPGELHECEWKNFGYNRTQAFIKANHAQAIHRCTYYFVMDADDQLIGSLENFKKDTSQADAYHIYIRMGSTQFHRLQLFHTRHCWKYVGVLHEYPTCDSGQIQKLTVPDCYIQDGRCGSRTTNTTDKYLTDANILLQGIRDEPDNDRYYFYLGQSYFDAGDYQNSIKYYTHRIKMGRWAEEVYYSMYRCVYAKYHLSGQITDVIPDFLRAYRYRPSRLEALFVVMDHFRGSDPKKGYEYGVAGYPACLEYPTDLLFVGESIHRYQFADSLAVCAFYAGDHKKAIHLNQHLLRLAEAGESRIDVDRVKQNLKFSQDAVANDDTEDLSVVEDDSRTTVCFYTGYSDIKYNGSNYNEMKVRGSEIAAVNLATCLAKQYRVFFCGYNIKSGYHEGVKYSTPEYLRQLLDNFEVDILIISKYVNYFTEFRNTAKQVYLWLHDVDPLPWLTGSKFHNWGYSLIYNQRDQINKVVCLSEWHQGKIQRDSGLDSDKFCVIGNGLHNCDFPEGIERVKYRFIYCSQPDRSLHNILDILPEIVQVIPEATLHIYTDLTTEFQCRIDKLDYVVGHGQITHDQVVTKFQESDVWLYIPDTFCETYCICALEAQRAGCLCFVSQIGSLPNIVGDRGVVFKPGDDRVSIIAKSLRDPEFIRERRRLMYDWSVEQTWENRTDEWIRQFIRS